MVIALNRWVNEIISAFYSRPFYYDLVRDRKDIGVRYVIFLTVLSTLFMPLYLWQNYSALQPVVKALPSIADTLPSIIFENNKISIDKPAPFRLNLGNGTQSRWIIIDPNYAIVDTAALAKVMRQDNILVLLTGERIMVMKNIEGELEMCELKWLPTFYFGYNQWKVLANTVRHDGFTLFSLIFMVNTLLLLLAYNIVMTLLMAGVIKIMSWIFRADVDVKAAIRLSAMVRIPATLVTSVPVLVGMPLGNGLRELIWWGYLLFVVLSAREPSLNSKD